MKDYIVIIEKMEEDFESDYQHPVTKKIVNVTNCNDEIEALEKAKLLLIENGENQQTAECMIWDDGYFYEATVIEFKEGVFKIN